MVTKTGEGSKKRTYVEVWHPMFPRSLPKGAWAPQWGPTGPNSPNSPLVTSNRPSWSRIVPISLGRLPMPRFDHISSRLSPLSDSKSLYDRDSKSLIRIYIYILSIYLYAYIYIYIYLYLYIWMVVGSTRWLCLF